MHPDRVSRNVPDATIQHTDGFTQLLQMRFGHGPPRRWGQRVPLKKRTRTRIKSFASVLDLNSAIHIGNFTTFKHHAAKRHFRRQVRRLKWFVTRSGRSRLGLPYWSDGPVFGRMRITFLGEA